MVLNKKSLKIFIFNHLKLNISDSIIFITVKYKKGITPHTKTYGK